MVSGTWKTGQTTTLPFNGIARASNLHCFPAYWVCLPICFVISTRDQLWFKILNIIVERLCDLYFCWEIRATCRHQIQWKKNLLRTYSKSFILILFNILNVMQVFFRWLFSVFGEGWSNVGSQQWEFKASSHQQNVWMHPWVELETNPSARSCFGWTLL